MTTAQSMRRLFLLFLFFIATASLWAQQYTLPQVPDSIRDATARADYATARFWERYNFCDTTLLTPDYAEQALADFIGLLRYASTEGREVAIERWLDGAKASPQVYNYFAKQADYYLYHPNSPLRDDELNLLVVRHVAQCEVADEAQRTRARFLLKLGTRNQVGDVVSDFTCQTADEKEHQLIEMLHTPLTLMLFYDPECDNCRGMIFRLRYSSMINQCISDGRLTFLAVNVMKEEEGEEVAEEDLPNNWLQVRDVTGVQEHLLYDLSGLPVLFLLDADGRVVQRQTDIHQVMNYLVSH